MALESSCNAYELRSAAHGLIPCLTWQWVSPRVMPTEAAAKSRPALAVTVSPSTHPASECFGAPPRQGGSGRRDSASALGLQDPPVRRSPLSLCTSQLKNRAVKPCAPYFHLHSNPNGAYRLYINE
jgi:hypothetical protein